MVQIYIFVMNMFDSSGFQIIVGLHRQVLSSGLPDHLSLGQFV